METFTEKWAYKIESHASVDEINPADYDGLIIPGGRAPEYIRMNPKVQEIAAHFLKENKPLGVICHGQLVLTTVREYIKGRELTAYIACRPEVEAQALLMWKKCFMWMGTLYRATLGRIYRDS